MSRRRSQPGSATACVATAESYDGRLLGDGRQVDHERLVVGSDVRAVVVGPDDDLAADEAVVDGDAQQRIPRRPAVAGPGPSSVKVPVAGVRGELPQQPGPGWRVEVAADGDALAQSRPRSRKRLQVSRVNRPRERGV